MFYKLLRMVEMHANWNCSLPFILTVPSWKWPPDWREWIAVLLTWLLLEHIHPLFTPSKSLLLLHMHKLSNFCLVLSSSVLPDQQLSNWVQDLPVGFDPIVADL